MRHHQQQQRRTYALVLLTVLATVVGMLGATPASAVATLPTAGSHVPTAQFPHCVQQAIPVGQKATTVLQNQPDCFASLAQAAAVAAHDVGLLGKSDAQVNAALTNRTANAAASVVTGTDYMDYHFGGATLTWSQGAPCSASRSYYANLAKPWINSIGSATNFGSSGCGRWWHYTFPNQNSGCCGGSIDCGYLVTGGCYSMGTQNDEAESEKWTHT